MFYTQRWELCNRSPIISKNNVTNDSYGETVNPDAETTMGPQNASSTPKELI